MKTGQKKRGLKPIWLWGSAIFLGCMFVAALLSAAAGAEQPRVVYVYSDTCGYCSSFTPKFEQAVKALPARQVERLDIHKQRELEKAIALGAQVTPTVFVLKKGEIVGKLEGDVTEGELQEFLRERMIDPKS